jgi:uncharacterized repeat protein (TIGR03847 family)
MGLGYDKDRDMVVLVIQGQGQGADPDDIASALEGDEPEAGAVMARISATRAQMRALSVHAARVVAAGRPICGNCGRPMDLSGHFCPERNGHGPVSPEDVGP